MIYGVWYGAKYGIMAGAAFLLMRTGEYIAGGAPESLSINAFLFLVGLGVALLLLSPPLANRQGARGMYRGVRRRAATTSARLHTLTPGRVINMGPSGAIVVKLH